MAYGDSIDSVQAARERIAESNASNYFRGRQQDEDAYRYDNSLQQQQAEFLNRLQRQQVEDANTRQALDYRAGRDAQADKTAAGYFDLTKQDQDWKHKQESPADTREKDFLYKRTNDAAANGAFSSPEEVKSFNPHISDAEAKYFYDQSAQTRQQQTDRYKYSDAAAGAKNRVLYFRDQLNTLAPVVGIDADGKPVPVTSPINTAFDSSDWKNKVAQRNYFKNAMDQASKDAAPYMNPKLADLTVLNVQTGRHEPAISAPSYFKQQAPVAVTAPAVAPQTVTESAVPVDVSYEGSGGYFNSPATVTESQPVQVAPAPVIVAPRRTAPVAPVVLPWPKSKSDLIDGGVYMTKAGLRKFSAVAGGFVPVEQ